MKLSIYLSRLYCRLKMYLIALYLWHRTGTDQLDSHLYVKMLLKLSAASNHGLVAKREGLIRKGLLSVLDEVPKPVGTKDLHCLNITRRPT